MKRYVIPLVFVLFVAVVMLFACSALGVGGPSYVKVANAMSLGQTPGDTWGPFIGSTEILRVDRTEWGNLYVCTIGYAPRCGYLPSGKAVKAAPEEVRYATERYETYPLSTKLIVGGLTALIVFIIVAGILLEFRKKSSAEKIGDGSSTKSGVVHSDVAVIQTNTGRRVIMVNLNRGLMADPVDALETKTLDLALSALG